MNSADASLRIAVDGTCLGGAPGGIGLYAEQLLRALAAAHPGDRLSLSLPRNGGELLLPPGTSAPVIIRTGTSSKLDISKVWWNEVSLSRWIRSAAPDVFFQPNFFLPPGNLPCPAVVMIHDISFRLVPGSKRPHFRYYLDRAVRRAVARAAGIVTHTCSTADDLCRHYGADRNRIRPIEPAPVGDPRPPEKAAGGLYFLHLSNFDPRKNVPRIVRAFAESGIADTGCRLILAGDGRERNDSIRLARQLGVADGCDFPGIVSEEQRRSLLAGARAFLFPSLFEGYGLPVVEAMQFGIPVLTSDIDSLAEAAGGAALTVDPLSVLALADALRRLANEDQLCDELGAAGRERASRLSWERTARELRRFLREVTHG